MSEEARIQKSVVDWFDYAASGYKLDKRLLCHIPNGGKRSKIEGARFKGMGVRAGHEDLFLSVPRGGKHGLFIEMKAPKGCVYPLQKEMMKLHEEQGYAVIICWSFDEAVSAIINYLKSGDPLKKA